MKRGLLFYALIVLMFGLSLNVSMPCFAQQNTIILAAKADAEFDAEEDVNTTLWLAAGGILGVVGNLPLGVVAMGGAYLYQPIPPAERLLGKPADYVSIYTDAYKARARRLQIEAAGKGALGGSATFCLLGMVLNIKAVGRLGFLVAQRGRHKTCPYGCYRHYPRKRCRKAFAIISSSPALRV